MTKKIAKQDVKAQILQAAEQEFLSVGYAGARTMNIAKNAGVTHAMLHYYYKSKENLFESVFSEKVAEFFGGFEAIMNSEKSFSEKAQTLMKTHRQIMINNAKLPLFIISEASKNPALLRKAIMGDKEKSPVMLFIQSFKREVEKAIRAKEIKSIKPLELLITLVSLNVFPVLAFPLIQAVGIVPEKEFTNMMKKRNDSLYLSFIDTLKKS